jgi:hypothetical protein
MLIAEPTDEPPVDSLEPTIVAWRDIPLPPLPELLTVTITIRADEMWCMRCGAEGAVYVGDSRTTPGQKCVKCGSRKLIPAVTVLRPGEYVLI